MQCSVFSIFFLLSIFVINLSQAEAFEHGHNRIASTANYYTIVVDIGTKVTRVYFVGLPSESDLETRLQKKVSLEIDLRDVATWEYAPDQHGSWGEELKRGLLHAVAHLPRIPQKADLIVVGKAGFRALVPAEQRQHWINSVVRVVDQLRVGSYDFRERVSKQYIVDIDGAGDGNEAEFLWYALNLALGTLDSPNTKGFVEIGAQAVRYVTKYDPEAQGSSWFDSAEAKPVTKSLGWKKKESWFAKTWPGFGSLSIKGNRAVRTNCTRQSSSHPTHELCTREVRRLFKGPFDQAGISALDGQALPPFCPNTELYTFGNIPHIFRTLSALDPAPWGTRRNDSSWVTGTLEMVDQSAQVVCKLLLQDVKARLSIINANQDQTASAQPTNKHLLLSPATYADLCSLSVITHEVLANGLHLQTFTNSFFSGKKAGPQAKLRLLPPTFDGVPVTFAVGTAFYYRYLNPDIPSSKIHVCTKA